MIIKTQSYTDNFPISNCDVKVAVKTKDWNNNCAIKTDVYNAIYDSGFVSIDGGKTYYLAVNFIFHKLKRNEIV